MANGTKHWFISLVLCCISLETIGQETAEQEAFDKYIDMSLEDLLKVNVAEEEDRALIFYGFLRANVEQVYDTLEIDETLQTQQRDEPITFNDPEAYLYTKYKVNQKVKLLFNVFFSNEDFELQNAWGNFQLSQAGEVRIGKMYRRFGQYNEKLTEFPVFIGIEPPELFDKDHLLIPKFANLAFHGARALRSGTLKYWIDTSNGESGPEKDVFPLAVDVRWQGHAVLFGSSWYTSSLNGSASEPDKEVGDGPPKGGILPWMDTDRYRVFGAFVSSHLGDWILEAAYFVAGHQGRRDPEAVLQVVRNTALNARQRERFLGESSDRPVAELGADDVVQPVDYDVETGYVRLAYDLGKLKPYLHYDFMSHPETIADKTWGGDGEVGTSDDGKFTKWSLGIVTNPWDKVAVKLDASSHVQRFNGATEHYQEVRFDVSWAFTSK